MVVIDAFVHAISQNQEQIFEKRVQQWTKQGTVVENLNRLDMDGQSPINVAARYGHLVLFQRLVKNGASLAHVYRDSVGNRIWDLSPLHTACRWGKEMIVRSICDSLLPSDRRLLNERLESEGGATPLHLAVKMGHERVVHVLTQYGCDPSIRDVAGHTPLGLANRMGESRGAIRDALGTYQTTQWKTRVRTITQLTCNALYLGSDIGSVVWEYLINDDEAVTEWARRRGEAAAPLGLNV